MYIVIRNLNIEDNIILFDMVCKKMIFNCKYLCLYKSYFFNDCF